MQRKLLQHTLLLQPLRLCQLLGWLHLSCQSVAGLPKSLRWIGTCVQSQHITSCISH
jgi:hypothetical protein